MLQNSLHAPLTTAVFNTQIRDGPILQHSSMRIDYVLESSKVCTRTCSSAQALKSFEGLAECKDLLAQRLKTASSSAMHMAVISGLNDSSLHLWIKQNKDNWMCAAALNSDNGWASAVAGPRQGASLRFSQACLPVLIYLVMYPALV